MMTDTLWTYRQSLWEPVRKMYAKEIAEDPAAEKRLWKKYDESIGCAPNLLGLVCEIHPLVKSYNMDDAAILKVLVAVEYMKMERRDKQNPLGIYMSEPLETDLGMTGENYFWFEREFMPYENSTFEAGLLKYYLAIRKANQEPVPEYYEEPF